MARPVDEMDEAEVMAQLATVEHWYHPIELRPGLFTPGHNGAGHVLKLLDLPEDCSGLRVLDLGARDGYFTFEMERRGADVTAIDYLPDTTTGFRVCADLLGSKAKFIHANIYDITPEDFGTFDIVLFLGLIYHLPDPLEALHRVRSVARGRLCLESHVIDNALMLEDGTTVSLASIAPGLERLPLMQFFKGGVLRGDPSNYWGPTLVALEAMATEALFHVTSSTHIGDRGIVNATVTENEQTAKWNRLSRAKHGGD